ncbi:MAG: signal peptidase I [Oscillospiraceae bacterium]|nr:signal peptidase I [Oscillospiraceae bacterium]
MEEKKKNSNIVKKELIRLLVKINLILATIAVLLFVVGGVFVVHDNDMYPSVRDGDLLITYRLGKYYTSDVVVYEAEGKIHFGRVVAIAGDVVDISDGVYTVNGFAPYETVYYETKAVEGGKAVFPYTVKEGEVFILADYREQGKDSRLFGAIRDLKGKVVLQLRRRGF